MYEIVEMLSIPSSLFCVFFFFLDVNVASNAIGIAFGFSYPDKNDGINYSAPYMYYLTVFLRKIMLLVITEFNISFDVILALQSHKYNYYVLYAN